ncbi:glycosyl transferase family 90-domain-containing protein [Mycena maculata]|uniref:Glycosyl transferase family 90-domain-containing protein n=1 Tax=Mycena maculata TaxID=230809 RepID=A0AAD7IUG1_9AGAR|nr:glycosyl transferase family 90-domain-containing protein [Mycena maculata]
MPPHLPLPLHLGPQGQVPSIYDRNDDPRTPLLSGSRKSGDWNSKRPSWVRRHRLLILVLAAVVVATSTLTSIYREDFSRAVVAMSFLSSEMPAQDPETTEPDSEEPFDPVELARLSVDALLSRQSTTLETAVARYILKTRRPPPPNYDQWFQFAQERSCLIDEYDQIHRDFEPFYQMAMENPKEFQEMVNRGAAVIEQKAVEMAVVEIKEGSVEIRNGGEVAYLSNWPITLGRFSAHLPDMKFLLNSRDEPRVAFNLQAEGSLEKAFHPEDATPFEIAPRPTAEFFKHHSGCLIPGKAPGFPTSINDDTAFLISSAKSGFTTDLYPIISMTKISPCFSDILFPTEYYYDQSWWSGKYAYPDNIPWEDKKPQIYWRGMSNGGQIIGSNFHSFPRFKLVDLGRAHPDIMDVAITRFAETLCLEGCDREAVMKEYNITGDGQSREDLYGYKYAVDLDGTTFSGRYLGLLRSGSLVFKATVFEEYFNQWLRPYEHYIPVLPDLSDLVEKITWANENPEEARLIQQRGMQVAKRILTDDQNDCYFFAVLLEWARLQAYAQTVGA